MSFFSSWLRITARAGIWIPAARVSVAKISFSRPRSKRHSTSALGATKVVPWKLLERDGKGPRKVDKLLYKFIIMNLLDDLWHFPSMVWGVSQLAAEGAHLATNYILVVNIGVTWYNPNICKL